MLSLAAGAQVLQVAPRVPRDLAWYLGGWPWVPPSLALAFGVGPGLSREFKTRRELGDGRCDPSHSYPVLSPGVGWG